MKKIKTEEITDADVQKLSEFTENIEDVVENSDTNLNDEVDIDESGVDNEIDEQYEIDPEKFFLYVQKADDAFEAGDFKAAKGRYLVACGLVPDVSFYCGYRLGWICELEGKYDKALWCYNKAIAENDNYPYLYLMKGCLLKKHFGNQEEAELCFRKCIEIEDGAIEEGICSQHAYAELGMRDQAIDVMNRLLEEYPDKAGKYYDAACMYCILQDYDLALDYLGTSLSKGYNMQHVLFDKVIDILRSFEKYQKILDYSQELPFDDAPYNDMSVK